MSALNHTSSQSAESDAEAGVDCLLYMRRSADTATRAEPLESPKSTETGATDANNRQYPAPESALPKPCCKLMCNYFSMLCRSCDVGSSPLLDEPLRMPHSVRDESFLEATGVAATRMAVDTRTGHVVFPKAAGDRRSAPCQRDLKRSRRESSGCTPRALKTPRAAWQALEKEQFLKRAATLGTKGESSVKIGAGSGPSIHESSLNKQTVGAHKGLSSVVQEAEAAAEQILSSRLIAPQPCNGCPPQVAEAAARWLGLIGGIGGAEDAREGATVGGGGGTKSWKATMATSAVDAHIIFGVRQVMNDPLMIREGEGGKEGRGTEGAWLEMSLGVGGGSLGDRRRPRLDIDLNF